MKRFFRIDGSLMNFLTKLFDICLINVFWLLCCLPVVTIGASTTAAYYTIVKVVRRDLGTLHHEFFRSFKSNLKDTFVINLCYLIIGGILFFNIYVTYKSFITTDSAMSLNMMLLYFILLVWVIGIGIYTYPVLSRFIMGKWTVIKFSLYAMSRHFLTTIVLVVLFIATVIIVMIFPPFVVLLPGLCLYLCSFPMEKILWKYMTDDMRREWNEMVGLDLDGKPLKEENM